jgi:hypothetical protein
LHLLLARFYLDFSEDLFLNQYRFDGTVTERNIMLEGDGWKYGDAPELSEIKRHKAARSRLLLTLPQYPMAIEGYVVSISPNCQFCLIQVGGQFNAWYAIDSIRILDVLPFAPRPQRIVGE